MAQRQPPSANEQRSSLAHCKKFVAAVLGAAAIGASVIGLSVSSASSASQRPRPPSPTTTPIKHVVVIFDENISFDHYFGTYPYATNPPGEPQFHAAPGHAAVNGLNDALLTANPNLDNPQRLDPSQALTCDQNHGYSAEQSAFDMRADGQVRPGHHGRRLHPDDLPGPRAATAPTGSSWTTTTATPSPACGTTRSTSR